MTEISTSEFAPPSPSIRARLPRSLQAVASRLDLIEFGTLSAILPDGTELVFRGQKPGPHAVLRIRDYAFARRLIAGDIGFAEGYIAGEWDTPSLADLIQIFAMNRRIVDSVAASPLVQLAQRARHWFNRNTRAGSRRNIHAHYDLGNAFYSLWLDPSMTYSSALGPADDLEAAQRAKYAAIAEAAGIRPGEHVLEIGCGWGGFAEFAAGTLGCRVTGITISEEQHRFAQARMAKAELSDKVDIRLVDYRDVEGSFDRIVSIEMFEAVGEEYWKTFYDTMATRLRPGGAAALQIITIREDLFARYQREMDFIRHYIFPGGMLPTLSHLRDLGAKAGFAFGSLKTFGADYAETCRIWRERFWAAANDVRRLGFDEKFMRIWTYYLAYCEGGFRAGTIDVCQIAYRKPA